MSPKDWLDILKEVLIRAGISAEIQVWTYRLILVGLAILGVIWFLAKINEYLKPLISAIRRPASKDDTERIINRRLLAETLEYEIKRISEMDNWNESHFTELETEVEVTGTERQSSIRWNTSLINALVNSQERLILLQGEPGGGKSVALRYVAAIFASVARDSRDVNAVLPVYVNLKEITRTPEQTIDQHLIRSFVLKFLNRLKDQDIDKFLLDEFDRGIREGTWLFLFDSFDEIPEILNSTNADQNVQAYSVAISDFLHGMNHCRGIVASRDYRGPQNVGWTKFTILGLTHEQKHWFVKNMGLGTEIEEELLEGISYADETILAMSRNPLFMSLLCEYVMSGKPFPENTHMVFESYITTRLERDQNRIEVAFGVSPEEVRNIAEQAAFIMSLDEEIGLNPTRNQLRDALRREKFTVHRYFDRALDALESIKLARTGNDEESAPEKNFTFAHRRFQEYFSTCVVLRNPERVSPRQLLLSGRWRETSLILLQTRQIEEIQFLFEEAEKITVEILNGAKGLIENPLAYVEENVKRPVRRDLYAMSLPDKIYHLFSLLQAGLGKRANQLPDPLVLRASQVVLTANEHSPLYERIWALEIAGIIYEPVLHWILRDMLNPERTKRLIWDVAFQQTSHLRTLPRDISQAIKNILFDSSSDDYYALSAYAKRLPSSSIMVEILQFTHDTKVGTIGIFNLSHRLTAQLGLFLLSILFCLILILSRYSIGLGLLIAGFVILTLFEIAFWTNRASYRKLLYEYDRILKPSEFKFAAIIYLNNYLHSERFLNRVNEIKDNYYKMSPPDKINLLLIMISPLLFILFVVVHLYLQERYPLLFNQINTTGDTISFYLEGVFVVVGLIVLIPLVLYIRIPYGIQSALARLWKAYYSMRDKHFLKWISDAEQKTIYIETFSELHEILGDFSFTETVVEFLYLVRVNQLISPTIEMIKGLADLSLKLEISQSKPLEIKEPLIEERIATIRDYLSTIKDVNNYFKNSHSIEPETGLRYSVLNGYSTAIIEQVNLLLNQIRSYQKD